MSGIQSTISFPIRKKCNFYGRKEDVAREDFSNATAKHISSTYIPTVRKIVTLTSSESESDSDIENTKVGKHKRVNVENRTNSTVSTPRRSQCSESDGKP